MAAGGTECFALPGSFEGVTRSYSVDPSGRLESAGEATGGGWHVRSAFGPEGRRLYVTTLTFEPGEEEDVGEGTGVHVRTFPYDPSDCAVGAPLGVAGMGEEPPSNPRVYGLEVHPNGRWLYQTTGSLREIRFYRLGEDRIPAPAARYDVTVGGTVVCAQIRRLELHPDGRTLYANCNNGDAGEGVDLALQEWRVAEDGSLEFRAHHTLEGMDGGITDPVAHPSGRWLYQPVGTADPAAPRGPGAYILTFAVEPNGALRAHAATPARVLSPEETGDPDRTHMFPSTLELHPDGSAAYATIHAALFARGAFPHEMVRYRLEESGGHLVEVARRPAMPPTTGSSHHGGTLVQAGGRLFFYSYLTDYDSIRGGVLQRYRIGGEHELLPLDPPYVPTGLRDARQPIAAP